MPADETHVERKVQLTGGSTYTVSLPKQWASNQQIEPGCTVNLYSRGDQLVMTRNGCGPEENRLETTINPEQSDPATLARSVAAAYTAGCDELTIEGVRTGKQRRAITQAIRGFIGLEVLSEDEQRLVARTMLDVGDLSPEQTLAQLERTTLSIHQEALSAVVEADGDRGAIVARQDDDIDRLFALISRGFQQSLVDPAVMMGDGTLTPFEYYMAARQLERIGDHAEKIAITAGRFSNPPSTDITEPMLAFGEQSRSLVKAAIAGLLEDSGALVAVIADADVLHEEIEALDQQVYEEQFAEGYLLGRVLDSLVRTVQYGVNIAEAGLQARYRSTVS